MTLTLARVYSRLFDQRGGGSGRITSYIEPDRGPASAPGASESLFTSYAFDNLWQSLVKVSGASKAKTTSHFCSHLQPGRLRQIDLEPIALALISAGHFGAGVAEMLLNVSLLNLGGGGEAGAQRVAAERQATLAFGKIAAQARGERACLDKPDDVLVGQPLPRNPAVLARDRPKEGTMADAAEPQPGLEEGDRAGVGARTAADFDVAPAGLAADGQERAFRKEFDPAGAVFGLAGPAIETDDF